MEGRGEGRDEEGGADDADVGPADEFLVGRGLVDVGAVDVEGEDGGGGDHLGRGDGCAGLDMLGYYCHDFR